MTFLDTLSKAVAIAVHPLMMPIYGTLFTLYGVQPWLTLPAAEKTFVLTLVGLGSCLVPLVIVGTLVMTRRLSGLEMPERKERTTPLLLTACATALHSLIMTYLEMPTCIVALTYGISLLTFIAAAISPRWKISLHGMGVGGLLGYIAILGVRTHTDFLIPAAIAITLAGLAGWSRLYTHAHRGSEVLAGFLTGLAALMLLTLF